MTKATVLARHFGARVELFLYATEQSLGFRRPHDTGGRQRALHTCVEQGRCYLESLRAAMAADIGVDTFIATLTPLAEAIVQRVQETAPDLVIKGAHDFRAAVNLTPDPNDWLLARTCPVPLMLTCGSPWAARPRFAAVVDMANPAALALPRSIVDTARYLACGCHASLDVVYSESGVRTGQRRTGAALALEGSGAEYDVQAERLQLLESAPEQTLDEIVKRRHYDVLFLGGLTPHGKLPGSVGRLTSQQGESLICDMVLMKPAAVAEAGLSCSAPPTVRAQENGAEVARVPLH